MRLNITRQICLGLLAVVAASAARAASIDAYPSKPIRLIVPFVPGGGTDTTGRIVAAKLTERWGQQVVVDNRTGAAGAIGVEVTANAAPDGYTICLISASHAVNAATNPQLPFDLVKDLQGLSQATSLFYVMYIHPSVPVKTLQEFTAYAKANPGKINVGSSGTGGLEHLAGEMYSHLAGVKMTHIPYKGGAAVLTDVLAGNIQLGYGTVMSSRSHVKAGKLRWLAMTAKQRSPSAPEVPTLAESGVPGYQVDQWYGIIASAKVPKPIVDKLSQAIAAGITSPETAQRLSAEGSTPVGSTAEQFTVHIRDEVSKWRKFTQEAGLKLH